MRALVDDPFELVLPKGHRFASRSAVRLDQLLDETWIGGIGAYHRILLRSCQEVGFEPRFAYRTDDYRAVQGFVAAGLGVAILPRLALALMPPGVERVVIRSRPPLRRISAARPAKSFRSPAADMMVHVLAEVAATL
jgi:DNA-binding transcriptional LysR family regulator